MYEKRNQLIEGQTDESTDGKEDEIGNKWKERHKESL